MLFKIREFFRSISRVVAWLPILWKDRDWDYYYLEQILKFKLRRMADCIESNALIVGYSRVVKQIRYAVYLIDRVQQDVDQTKEFGKFQEKWGKPEYSFKPSPRGKGYSQLVTTYPKGTTPELHGQADSDYIQMMRRVADKEEELHERLYNHIRKYVRGWWD